jgi:hypothetical protein
MEPMDRQQHSSPVTTMMMMTTQGGSLGGIESDAWESEWTHQNRLLVQEVSAAINEGVVPPHPRYLFVLPTTILVAGAGFASLRFLCLLL